MLKVSSTYSLLFLSMIACMLSCGNEEVPTIPVDISETEEEETVVEKEAIIDLSNWKVTLPIGDPTEVSPPQILDYRDLDILKPYFYDNEDENALVFFTEPGTSTKNSSYSRTELREQMQPGSNNTNWTFEQGGRMRGTLRMNEISTDDSGDFHRSIIMQIHGRLTNAQRDLIGKDDNNAPPVLKIYWVDGKVRVHRKVLKDENITYPEILFSDAWTDESFYFDREVSYEPFTLEVIVTKDEMKVVLDDSEEMIFNDIHVERWNVFENYFKAGNYLITTDPGAFARVLYYDLEVSH